MKSTIIILIILINNLNAFSQKNFWNEAEKAFNNRKYYSAIELYKTAYSKSKTKDQKATIIFKIGECYRMIGDSKQAEVWYTKAMKVNYPDPYAQLYLANAKKSQGKYDEAKIEYTNYSTKVPSDKSAENAAKSCELAQKWKEKPTRYVVENVLPLNTPYADFAPTYIDKKYKKLYFTSMRGGAIGNEIDPTDGQNFSDLFEASVDKNGKWSTPITISETVNTKNNEGLSTLTKKGDIMIFTRCIVKKNEDTYNQLWQATRVGNSWGEPEKLPFCVDSLKFASPSLTADGQTLFFSSNMPGGQGGNDIWMVQFDKKNKQWGTPINLGTAINTEGDEIFPFIHPDGTLYFSSNTHLGMGGLDIFKAEKKGETQWGNVTNMQYPINSPADDFGIIFEADKERGYLSSNRVGTKGSDDIWSFVLPPLCFNLDGYVNNCEFSESIEGVIIKLTGSDGSVVETKTDSNGYYSFKCPKIQANTSYSVITQVGTSVITLKADLGFFNSKDKFNFTTIGVVESKNFNANFCLPPIKRTENRFPDVLYLTDKFDLNHPSHPQDSLDILYQTLIDNPTYVIELSSHTDYRSDSKYNRTLSEKRAKSCVDYLISKGIHPDRLIAKGYGEDVPLEIDSNKDGVIDYKLTKEYIDKVTKLGKSGFSKEEYEALMQKNRRTVFKVIRKDFIDPNAPKEMPKVTSEKKEVDEKEVDEEE